MTPDELARIAGRASLAENIIPVWKRSKMPSDWIWYLQRSAADVPVLLAEVERLQAALARSEKARSDAAWAANPDRQGGA